MNKATFGKVSIIGAGFVGSTTAYTLMMSGIISELVLVDMNKEKAIGEVMDLNHGIPFLSPCTVIAGEYSDITDSDIVIITAGAAQKPGETRLELVKRNTEIFKGIISQIVKYAPNSIILVVTNPVDILTYITFKLSGFPKNKVIGSGTVLDTSRFRYLLSKHIGIDTRNIHAYILGEHGDSEVPIWSATNVAGITMDEYCNQCGSCSGTEKQQIFLNVKNAAYEIINRKGATYYAVALAVKRIVECILRNENSILTVSSYIENVYGISDVCISLPTVVNNNGINRIINVSLSEEELLHLQKSAIILKEIINQLQI